ncbi:MAG: hypothetical protein L0Y79_06310 [Chlorobi bacterium]|nr:hypothetical protein [Chlorobiota bacterium]MCI0715344.1 hypothetical protein [Chlorobiota bacterium]
MLKFKLTPLLFVGLAVLFGCNSSSIKKTNDVNKKGDYLNPYFPAAEGNYWTYINEAPREETETFTIKVETIKDKIAGLTSFPYLTKESSTQNISVNEKGEIEITGYFGSSGVIFPAAENFKKGYQWHFGVFGGLVNEENFKIETEAGTFENCRYVTLSDGFTFSFEMWFKKGTGIVKWGANRTNPPTLKFIYYVLKEYKVN